MVYNKYKLHYYVLMFVHVCPLPMHIRIMSMYVHMHVHVHANIMPMLVYTYVNVFCVRMYICTFQYMYIPIYSLLLQLSQGSLFTFIMHSSNSKNVCMLVTLLEFLYPE